MIHYVFIFATWAIGLFGVAGAAAVAIAVVTLGPAAAIAIVQPIVARFLACTWCIVAVVFVFATTGAYWIGHHEAEKSCRAEALEAQLRNQKIDLDNAKKSEADQIQRANTIEAQSHDQQTKDAAYIAALQNRPACVLDDNDVGGVPDHKSRPRFAKPAAGAR